MIKGTQKLKKKIGWHFRQESGSLDLLTEPVDKIYKI